MKRFIIKSAIAALFSLSAVAASAGYAQLAPPPGWYTTSGGIHTFTPGAAANSATLANGTVRTNASLNLGGRAVSMPATFRFAANAPRIAAAALYLSPQLRTAAAIASWLGLAKVVWDAGLNQWVTENKDLQQSTGVEYNVLDWYPWRSTEQQACNDVGDHWNKNYAPRYGFSGLVEGGTCYLLFQGEKQFGYNIPRIEQRASQSCPAGWYVTPAGCVQTPPPKTLTPEEMADLLDPAKNPNVPFPETLPWDLPNIPWPVTDPVINPNPDQTPVFVPTGDPIPNPNFNPNVAPGPNNQPWLLPGVRVVPTPDPWNPWRVDVKPILRPVPGPSPIRDYFNDPFSNPWDIPDPSRDLDKDICLQNPTSILCEKGDFTDKELPKVPKLYERKYPDGMLGIWNQKKEAFMSSNLGTLAGAMMPTGMQAGTCPSFQLDLSMSSWADFGTRDLSPPCWVWDFAKVVVLISAVILARQLIFGG